MVNGQLAIPAAVLAGVSVAVEDADTGELALRPGPADDDLQPDDRGYGEGGAGGVDVAQPVLEHLGLARYDLGQGPSRLADVQWFVALVEHQHRAVD